MRGYNTYIRANICNIYVYVTIFYFQTMSVLLINCVSLLPSLNFNDGLFVKPSDKLKLYKLLLLLLLNRDSNNIGMAGNDEFSPCAKLYGTTAGRSTFG